MSKRNHPTHLEIHQPVPTGDPISMTIAPLNPTQFEDIIQTLNQILSNPHPQHLLPGDTEPLFQRELVHRGKATDNQIAIFPQLADRKETLSMNSIIGG